MRKGKGMEKPEFKCNYGGAEQWSDGVRRLYDPTVHRGYHHLVASGILAGSYGHFLAARCAQAAADGAPKDSAWQRVTSIADFPQGGYEWRPVGEQSEEHKAVVAALVQYESSLKAARR